jgi:hypothetical protein
MNRLYKLIIDKRTLLETIKLLKILKVNIVLIYSLLFKKVLIDNKIRRGLVNMECLYQSQNNNKCLDNMKEWITNKIEVHLKRKKELV